MISLGSRRIFGFLLLTALVAGCGEEPATPPAPPTDAAPAPADAPPSKDPVGAASPIVPK